jgi:hypothetical protein
LGHVHEALSTLLTEDWEWRLQRISGMRKHRYNSSNRHAPARVRPKIGLVRAFSEE